MIRYSIAETKNRLPAVVKEVEEQGAIEITRRGKPVAVILSLHEYERLKREKTFWSAYQRFRRRVDLEEVDIDPDEVFTDVRDRTSGREVAL
ncbi:MAG: type II toxin-antitoxin system Phd/YefM family antitoxin [Chloroflexi bacterium]|nr:type II toxin-antitoxin system Phd/YefM family antitoxin [Chloroflexota bacterium]